MGRKKKLNNHPKHIWAIIDVSPEARKIAKLLAKKRKNKLGVFVECLIMAEYQKSLDNYNQSMNPKDPIKNTSFLKRLLMG